MFRETIRQLDELLLRRLKLALLGLLLVPQIAFADVVLLMAEEDGCVWCETWDEEIGHIYPKTTEGQAAPLVRYDLHGDPLEHIQFDRKVHYTPTFVLVRDNVEVGRIEGYPGEDFFWGLLTVIFEEAEVSLEPAS